MKHLTIISSFIILFVVNACTTTTTSTMENTSAVKGTHSTWVTLTVAESKRLIAKGLMVYPPFVDQVKEGRIIVTKGTTNTYIAEELLGKELSSGDYVLGHILPANTDKKVVKDNVRPELVLVNGQLVQTPYVQALDRMQAGNIILKGANIINYDKQQAGVCIGHPTGGTVGNIIPHVKKKNLRLVIPVGLDKCSSQDINQLSDLMSNKKEKIDRKVPTIWSIKGELFTEIEALKQMADVDVLHLASGGIGGAEGSVSLAISGSEQEVHKALDFIKSVQGEPAYLD